MEIALAQQNDATLAELLGRARDTLQRRWKTFAVVALGIFVVLAVAVFFLKPNYTATVHVRIDPTRDPVATQRGDAKSSLSDESIDTEVSAFYSLALAKTVVDELRLTNDAAFAPSNDDPLIRTSEDRKTAVATTLLRKLAVFREQQTYVLNVAFEDRDPVKAAQIANSFASNYIKGAVGSRTSVASAQAQWYREQLAELSGQIAQADGAAARFKAAHGLTVGTVDGSFQGTITDQQVPSLAASLADAESSAAAAKAEYQAARAQSARAGSGSVGAVLQSPIIAQLQAQRATAVQQQTQAAAQYGPRHPVSRQNADNVASIDRQIAAASSRVISSLGSAAASADARAASLRTALGQVENVRTEQARASVVANTLDRDAQTKRDLYKQLSEEAQGSLQASQNSMSSATIVDQAIPPKEPSSPNKPLYLALAAILGAMAGAATIAIQEMLSGSIRSTEDIEEKLGLRMLAAVPYVEDKHPASLLMDRPTSFYAESFRIARTALFGSKGWPAETPIIAFTSSLPGDGKTTSSLAFARSLSDTERRTLLIDCDVRRAAMQEASGINPGKLDLIAYLQGRANPDEITIKTDSPHLDVIMVNAPFFNSTNLFESDRMARLLEVARQNYDQIVLDLPPIVGLADGRNLAALADAIVFVVKWNSTPLPAARNALDALQAIGREPAGVLVNAVAETSGMLAGGYYLDRYSNYYQSTSS
ncbi:AAA family ATPase [Novosphingobium sp. AP12]|uniref:GumC family protein n=1 Tax=Novosphingobium sp. AP12 TaxID=1144305 RepID=UPI0002720FED|nr:AAA family ATPase [Novosphingobium sp. AP12]EJL28309.1 hypothetical protein involved in exopolysaccharide biosynthesis [Novosphingobium sp. AP12]